MKNYKRSNYAANKSSENIVYKSEVSDDVDITLEDFLASDSSLTEADYKWWKNFLNKEDREEELHERRTTRKDVSFEGMTEVVDFMGTTLEEEYEDREIERLQKAAIAYAMFHLYADIRISDISLRRAEMFFFKGMGIIEIAKKEGIYHSAVKKSIDIVRTKLIQYCHKYMEEHDGDFA